MAACYHPAVTFSDEVFSDLEGARAAGMWRMLCERGKDLRVEFRDIEADDSAGRAHWEAWYTFSPTGRQVHNRIEAEFEFRDGKIIRHRDRFSFWNWARQSLGPRGWRWRVSRHPEIGVPGPRSYDRVLREHFRRGRARPPARSRRVGGACADDDRPRDGNDRERMADFDEPCTEAGWKLTRRDICLCRGRRSNSEACHRWRSHGSDSSTESVLGRPYRVDHGSRKDCAATTITDQR